MSSAGIRRALTYGLGLSLLWLSLAAARPSVTFHLAPLLVAASVPWVYVADQRQSAAIRNRLAMVALGFVLAVSVTTLLTVTNLLDGPSLLPVGDGVLESYVGAFAGGLVGLGSLFWERPVRAVG